MLPDNSNEALLQVNKLFTKTIFHTITHNANTMNYVCEMFDAKDITKPQAESLLEQLVGLDPFHKLVRGSANTAHKDAFRAAVKTTLGRPVSAVPARKNMIVQGPSGTGKTTAAKTAGIYYVANKMVPNTKVVVANALDICGNYVGDTKTVVAKFFDICEGAVMAIDSAGSWATETPSQFIDETRILFNDLMEGFNAKGGIAIFVDYPHRIQNLLNSEPGFQGRFPQANRIQFFAHDDPQTRLVLNAKIAAEGLALSDGAEERAMRELQAAKVGMGDGFNNGRTTEEYVIQIINQHSVGFPITLLEGIASGSCAAPENLLVIDEASIPTYNSKTRNFSSQRTGLHVASKLELNY